MGAAPIRAQPLEAAPQPRSDREAKGGTLPGPLHAFASPRRRLLGSAAVAGTREIAMPRDKDLKRVIRTRMQKTGESYTTARSHLVSSGSPAAPPAAPVPAIDTALAGHTDAVIEARTGRDWAAWVRILDDAGAATLTHTAIARMVREQHGVDGWWAQTVTVGYERIRGLREVGQRRSGEYEVNRSRTLPLPVDALFDAIADDTLRSRWLDSPGHVVRTATRPKSMRLGLTDGTIVVLGFAAKGDAKSTLYVQHTKLTDRATADAMKAFWSARLDALAALLAEGPA